MTPQKQYLAARFRAILDHKIVVVLQHNNLSTQEWIDARSELSKHGFSIKAVRNKVVKAVLVGSRYEAMAPLFVGPTALMFGNTEPQMLHPALGFVAKTPKLLVVGAKAEESLLDRDDLPRLLALPGLDQLRAQLVATIQGPMVMLTSLLQQPAQNLLLNMQQLVKQQEDPAEKGSEKRS